MHKIIHNLRKQPEEVRRHILHIVVIAFAVILVILWVYSLGVKLNNENTQYELKESIKPFQDLGDDIGSDINSL